LLEKQTIVARTALENGVVRIVVGAARDLDARIALRIYPRAGIAMDLAR
jgi:hypothetical protein